MHYLVKCKRFENGTHCTEIVMKSYHTFIQLLTMSHDLFKISSFNIHTSLQNTDFVCDSLIIIVITFFISGSLASKNTVRRVLYLTAGQRSRILSPRHCLGSKAGDTRVHIMA